jgi:hypothetical protein
MATNKSQFYQFAPPRLPAATEEYDPAYMSGMLNILNLFFQRINSVQPISIASLNINIDTLPTQTSLANLRSGDVYRDTTASNVLKVKV